MFLANLVEIDRRFLSIAANSQTHRHFVKKLFWAQGTLKRIFPLKSQLWPFLYHYFLYIIISAMNIPTLYSLVYVRNQKNFNIVNSFTMTDQTQSWYLSEGVGFYPTFLWTEVFPRDWNWMYHNWIWYILLM